MTPTAILHLSDIHRTPDEPATNDEILHSLKADLDRIEDEGVPRPNLLVVSGDLTQSAASSEYDDALALLAALADHLHLCQERVIVVPGNHDVDWKYLDGAWKSSRSRPAGVHDDYVVPPSPGGRYAHIDEDAYDRRLGPFRDFYRRLTGRDYPSGRAHAYTLHDLPDAEVALAAFSSCDTVDDMRFAARIHPAAIASAAEALAAKPGVRIAVWHHDLNWRQGSTDDHLHIDSARALSERVFSFALCGHTHRPAIHDATQIDGLALPIVSAGSLCAGRKQRGESTPRAYNVLVLGPEAARVYVRVKDEKGLPWKPAVGSRRNNSWSDHFEIRYARVGGPSSSQERSVDTGPRGADSARAPTPFVHMNAKETPKEEVLATYVPTNTSRAFDSDVPQFVLGPRGSGKTAMLISLSAEGQIKAQAHGELVFSRLGLFCPMRLTEVTSFTGKGWMRAEQRSACFRAFVATVWAEELARSLGVVVRHVPRLESEQCRVASDIGQLWLGEATATFAELKSKVRAARAAIVSQVDAFRRKAASAKIPALPLMRGGAGPLSDAQDRLSDLPCFRRTKWFVMFDEVEHLNEWQQAVVYEYIAHANERASAKIATLPYAHTKVTKSLAHPIVEGSDYQELTMTLSGHGASNEANFSAVAQSIWKARLRRFGVETLDLSAALPDPSIEDVLRDAGSPIWRRADLEAELLSQLRPEMRARAQQLRQEDKKSFSDQYWRRYQQPFRFRLALRLTKSARPVPLYWGMKTLLRAVDGNCRWFLQLLDTFWREHWSREGLRPLTPMEQHAGLVRWAKTVLRASSAIPPRGEELADLINKIVGALTRRLLQSQFISKEVLAVQPLSLSQAQAEAMAVGIAHGYFVPRQHQHESDATGYPTDDIIVRLGYPIAVATGLPLRSGDCARIGSLAQVAFPWWQQ